MTEIYLAAAALGVVAVLVLVAGARRTGRQPAAESPSAVFANRRRELAAEAGTQGLDAREAAELEQELALDHLDDAEGDQLHPEEASPTRAPLVPLLVGAILAVVAALVLYSEWGEPNAPLIARAPEILEDGDPEEIRRLESALAKRVVRESDDANTWFLLGHLRMRAKDFRGAATAFAALHDKAGPNAEVDLAWVQASYLADGGKLTAASRAIVERVLAANPEHPSALEFLAMDATHRRDFAGAAEFLARALQQSMPASRRASLAEFLALVRARLPKNPANGDEQDVVDKPTDAPNRIVVLVSLDAVFEVDATMPVFVIARDPLNPRPPLAVRRVSVGDLPARIELTDADAMMPGRSLIDVDPVQVLARVSLGGSPSARPGDLESAAVSTGIGAEPVSLRIDRRVE